MTDDQPAESIPPPVPLNVVARGVSVYGRNWTLQAGGTSSRYYTFMNIEFPGGRVTGGGQGGPPLRPGNLLNCSVHWNDNHAHYLIGRTHPAVKRLCLEFANSDPSRVYLEPVGKSDEFGISFFAEELPAAADLVNISGWDEGGHCLGNQSTAHLPGPNPA